MVWQSPYYLLFLLIVPWLIPAVNRQLSSRSIRYSTVTHLQGIRPTWRVRLGKYLPWLTVLAVVLTIVALARPQIGAKEFIVRKPGVDIILALDVSTSMRAEDFSPGQNRLDIIKKVTQGFISGRPNDRIGMVVFAARPYILSPLTWDHDWAEQRLAETRTGMIEDSTAIGSALASAVNRLRESKAKSKVVILLTDGVNNAGNIQPDLAAQAARTLGITVYTIGAGSKGPVPYPVYDEAGQKHYQQVQIDLDEKMLQKIAGITHGQYFRATDTPSLKRIFKRIDRMEKTVIEMPKYREYQDLYPYLLGLAAVLLVAETLLANTVFRRLP